MYRHFKGEMKMIKVLATVGEGSLERFGMTVPEKFKVTYLGPDYTDDEFIEKTKGAKFVLLGVTRLNENMIENLEDTELIQVLGAGYDGVDIKAARKKGIYVANGKGINSISVAEHTIGLILAALRRTVESNKDVKNFRFEESYKEYQVRGTRTLKSTHVGIVGLGDIGVEVIKRLKAFGPKISYNSNSRKKDLEKEYAIDYLELDELLKTCDIVSIHTPLNSHTEGMIDGDKFKLMKKDSIIVNTARGEIINQEAIADALKNGEIGMAALDTISPEPPDRDHPLLNLSEEIDDKLILTTHIAGITTEDMVGMQKNAWSNMERVLRGEKPINIINNI